MKIIYIFAISILLFGCVSTSDVTLPTGEQGYNIHCGQYTSIGDCYEKAGELCGTAGYQIYDIGRQRTDTYTVEHDMLIGCNHIENEIDAIE